MTMPHALFDRIGGFAKVRLLVSDLYRKILDSPVLAPYFAGIDMRRLIDHQTRFVTALLEGPESFSDGHIARAHARYAISAEAYDELIELFRETLEDFGLTPAEIDRVHAHLLALQPHVVTQQTAGQV